MHSRWSTIKLRKPHLEKKMLQTQKTQQNTKVLQVAHRSFQGALKGEEQPRTAGTHWTALAHFPTALTDFNNFTNYGNNHVPAVCITLQCPLETASVAVCATCSIVFWIFAVHFWIWVCFLKYIEIWGENIDLPLLFHKFQTTLPLAKQYIALPLFWPTLPLNNFYAVPYK